MPSLPWVRIVVCAVAFVLIGAACADDNERPTLEPTAETTPDDSDDGDDGDSPASDAADDPVEAADTDPVEDDDATAGDADASTGDDPVQEGPVEESPFEEVVGADGEPVLIDPAAVAPEFTDTGSGYGELPPAGGGYPTVP